MIEEEEMSRASHPADQVRTAPITNCLKHQTSRKKGKGQLFYQRLFLISHDLTHYNYKEDNYELSKYMRTKIYKKVHSSYVHVCFLRVRYIV